MLLLLPFPRVIQVTSLEAKNCFTGYMLIKFFAEYFLKFCFQIIWYHGFYV
jgi:hypothetical protein